MSQETGRPPRVDVVRWDTQRDDKGEDGEPVPDPSENLGDRPTALKPEVRSNVPFMGPRPFENGKS